MWVLGLELGFSGRAVLLSYLYKPLLKYLKYFDLLSLAGAIMAMEPGPCACYCLALP